MSAQKPTQLHAVLAAETDLRGASDRILDETKRTFVKKPHLFQGVLKTYEKTHEDGANFPGEHTKVDSTVAEKLQYASQAIAAYIDNTLTKEKTNAATSADVILSGGDTFVAGLPAPALLNFAERLRQIREMLEAIPTLEPGKFWEQDKDERPGVFSALSVPTVKTKKELKITTAFAPTDKHPGQYVESHEDVIIGHFNTKPYSGLISPIEKSKMIARCEQLRAAVKEALSKANQQEVERVSVGEKAMNFIINGA